MEVFDPTYEEEVSSPLSRVARFLTRLAQEDPGVHLVRRYEGFPEDLLEEERENSEIEASAEIVEGGEALRIYPVKRLSDSGFTFFLDGVQRARCLCHYQGVPVFYGYTAGAIRQRGSDRLFSTWAGPECRHNLFLPLRYLDIEKWKRETQMEVVDILPERFLGRSFSMVDLLHRTRQAIHRCREEIEGELIQRWVGAKETEGQWLLIDGPLSRSITASRHPRIVGLIKTHSVPLFPWAEYQKILQMEEGQRTSVFRPIKKSDWAPVFSWYLRLFSPQGRRMDFGLVRVEISHERDWKTLSELADLLSSWLMAERRPLSRPDPRWDRLIYPIYECEQFLKALGPSRRLLEGLLR